MSQIVAANEVFKFHYTFNGESLVVKQEAKDTFQAMSVAAKTCFQHFKGKQKLNSDKGLDLIDTCANPRKI